MPEFLIPDAHPAAALDRAWFQVTVQDLGVARDDVIQALASIIHRGVGQA